MSRPRSAAVASASFDCTSHRVSARLVHPPFPGGGDARARGGTRGGLAAGARGGGGGGGGARGAAGGSAV
eukprot:7047953-Prymnesium_polylepis.1